MRARILPTVCLSGALLAAMTLAAAAQSATLPGCAPSRIGDPPRAVFTCPNGLVLEVEAAAKMRVVRGAASNATALEGGAMFVTVPTGTRFQIRTPNAIASVRGTQYAVDVTTAGTSVFVAEGRVRVTSAAGGSPVTLSAGEGVDVAPGDADLTVTTWPADRAARLLARFGR